MPRGSQRAQLFRAITYKLEPPAGYKECWICGGLVEMTPAELEKERARHDSNVQPPVP